MIAAAVVLLAGCKDDNAWYDNRNYGVFTFNESEQVVEVTPDMRSFRLEGHYLKRPDSSLDGMLMMAVDDEETTAREGFHYLGFAGDYFWVLFDKNPSGDVYYYDVEIIPDNIDREMYISFFNVIISNDQQEGDNYPERISSVKIILKPAE